MASRKTSLIWITLVMFSVMGFAVGVYLFGIVGWDGLTTRAERDLWRARSRSIIAELRLGMQLGQVLEIAHRQSWPEDRIWEKGTRMILSSPTEFGASNWVIVLGFSEEKLSSVRVRTEDSISDDPLYRPDDAPEDIFGPNISH